ncbi:MAG TPA: ATP-binding cassette domain-containing protein [Rhizomicrobium sp.]|nr:ATP-binding cassette domain-containing protein [Rhizomicrobium sp.]
MPDFTPTRFPRDFTGSREAAPAHAGSRPAGERQRVRVRHGLTIMRRDENAAKEQPDRALLLDHPTVSHRHARFSVANERVSIEDLGSASGTWVNSTRISAPAELKPGDQISVGVYLLRFDGTHVEVRSHTAGGMLGAYSVSKQIREEPNPLFLLRDVTLELPPHELVCVIGASGSGKTTLMNIISGRKRPTSGAVKLGRFDVHECFNMLKQDIAYVPQRDPLHESLTLRQALTYSAKLRLPGDMSKKARNRIVLEAAESVGLEHRLDARIATLSGGERKRASLATEILSHPDLLFLDEVTTGLDEATDREIMQLLKQLVLRGMTIICVTHTLANIEEVADVIVVMGKGGLVTFYGSPAELRSFFSIRQLGEVFEAIGRAGAEAWHRRFEEAWGVRETARARARGASDRPNKGTGASVLANIANAIRQFAILTSRNVALLLGDRRALAMSALQAVVVGALLGLAFGDFGKGFELGNSKVSFLVVLGITCIWIGCAGSAKSLVGELPIYLRERDINLSTVAFVLSKFLVMGAFAVCQVLLLMLVCSLLIPEIPGPVWEQYALAALAAISGTAIGLVISSVSNSRDQAAVIVPLALAPQLIFGSGLVSALSWYGEKLAQFAIAAYWTRQAMIAALISRESGIMKIDAVHGKMVPVTAHALGSSLTALGLQTLAWLLLATAIMHLRYGRKTS